MHIYSKKNKNNCHDKVSKFQYYTINIEKNLNVYLKVRIKNRGEGRERKGILILEAKKN